jgi:cell division protein FtsB
MSITNQIGHTISMFFQPTTAIESLQVYVTMNRDRADQARKYANAKDEEARESRERALLCDQIADQHERAIAVLKLHGTDTQ